VPLRGLGHEAGRLFSAVVRPGQAPDEVLQRCDPWGILVLARGRAVAQRRGMRQERGLPIAQYGPGDLMLAPEFGAALGA
jgi:hypothetical protein